MGHWRLGFLIAVLFAMCVPAAHAQAVEHESDSAHETTHESHRNVLSFFVGVTQEERRENGAALGIAYERHLGESFGVGVIAERTFGDLDFWVYAVPIGYRTGAWKLYVAPGIEDGDHGSESLVRLGAEYAFEAGRWEISPQLAVDFVDGNQVLVLGVVFGWGF